MRILSASDRYVSVRTENNGSTKLSAKGEMHSRGDAENAKASARASHGSVAVGSNRVEELRCSILETSDSESVD